MSIDYEDIPEVDAKLVQLAKDCNGFVVTNDFNLNKVASFQKVKTLNVNELAGAIKTVVLPGESMRVEVVAAARKTTRASAIWTTAQWLLSKMASMSSAKPSTRWSRL